jgi:hypothetical protein
MAEKIIDFHNGKTTLIVKFEGIADPVEVG